MNKIIQGLILLLFGIDAHAEAFSAIATFMSSYGGYISAAMSAVSAISGAQQQKQAAKYNQKIANQQAVAAQQEAAANADKQRRAASKTIGSMQASYAASGVTLEGSPLEVLEQSARNAKLDELNILWSGDTRAQGYRATANLEGARASNAMTSGYLSGAGNALFLAGRYGSYGGSTTTSSSSYEDTSYTPSNLSLGQGVRLQRIE
jgi:hypothetical protein